MYQIGLWLTLDTLALEQFGGYVEMSALTKVFRLKSIPWSLAEFRHNKIVQSPHGNYFNVCQKHKEKLGLVKTTICFLREKPCYHIRTLQYFYTACIKNFIFLVVANNK